MSEVKNTLDGNDSKSDSAEESLSELKSITIEVSILDFLKNNFEIMHVF